MNEETARRLEKAARAIQAARVQLQSDLPEFAASDGYYALFYVAEALLLERGLTLSSHKAVHSAFGQTFAKTMELDPKYHRWILDAFQRRQDADYNIDAEVTVTEAEEIIGWAEEFLEVARDHLG